VPFYKSYKSVISIWSPVFAMMLPKCIIIAMVTTLLLWNFQNIWPGQWRS